MSRAIYTLARKTGVPRVLVTGFLDASASVLGASTSSIRRFSVKSLTGSTPRGFYLPNRLVSWAIHCMLAWEKHRGNRKSLGLFVMQFAGRDFKAPLHSSYLRQSPANISLRYHLTPMTPCRTIDNLSTSEIIPLSDPIFQWKVIICKQFLNLVASPAYIVQDG